MNQSMAGLQQFKNHVAVKFQLYNSLFTALPFHRIEKTGILLSLFLNSCEEGYAGEKSPSEITEQFFQKHTTLVSPKDQLDILFRFIQFVERQVVLFDALEDAAFTEVNDTSGPGTLKQLELEVRQQRKEKALAKKLETFSVRMVLTAHPTQFYTGAVLGIINDLAKALAQNNASQINTYLQQLGKTAFLKKSKPTPYDEAISLIWFLENVFYAAAGRITSFMKTQFPDALPGGNSLVNMGFWPGGDRDGNPFVTTEITLKVAEALRGSIIKCYYQDIRKLRRRLTFNGVDIILANLENELYENIFIPGNRTKVSQENILRSLNEIKSILVDRHDGLFLHLVDNLINKVNVFGLHFASLDVRQESSIHNLVFEEIAVISDLLPADYKSMSDSKRLAALSKLDKPLRTRKMKNELVDDTLKSIKAIKTIQQFNGEAGCNRYIISQCKSALNVLEVYGLFIICGWEKQEMNIDIVPLFETVEDLKNAAGIIRTLYTNKIYSQHLKRRNNRQTIMLGFSDGTKDGGYLMANWSIYKAKEELTSVSKDHLIDVVFFDGRGGPPARGGGKTHKFYASMGKNISSHEIQLTIQGQTVSSSFGTIDSAQYNIEQLLHAGITNDLFNNRAITLTKDEEKILQQLSNESFAAYIELKNHRDFVDYLYHVSPINFYAETNIGSRPSARGGSNKAELKNLRAIPFVGAWSQLKQNVTGFYGVGTALAKLEAAGKFKNMKALYDDSLFFRTLIDNCEMAMMKCFFPLTQYLAKDEKYGEIWNMIFDEYNLTLKSLHKLSGKKELMSDYPVERMSISMREKIVLPLVTIQQFAITKIREIENERSGNPLLDTYKKLVIRCSFGIINAGRNSA